MSDELGKKKIVFRALICFALLFLCSMFTVKEAYAASKPGKVENISVDKTTTQSATVSFKKVSDASGYEVQIYASGNKLIYSGLTKYTQKAVSGLTPATKYKIKVRAYKWTGSGKKTWGEFSDYVYFGTRPEKITKMSTTNYTDSSVTLTWSKVKGATGYYVYVWDNVKSNWKFLKGTTKPQYTAKGMQAGVYYEYMIKPFYKYSGKKYVGESYRKKVIARPGKVENIEVVSTSLSKMTVTWDKAAGATAYEVFVYEDGKLIKTYLTKYATRKLTGLKETAEYKIVVKPQRFCTKKIKLYGQETVITAYTKPASVKDIKVEDIGKDYITVGFNAVSGVDGYVVYIYSTSTPDNVITAEVSENKYTFTGLVQGENYIVKAQTKKNIGNSVRYGEMSKEKVIYLIPSGITTHKYYNHSENGFTVSWDKKENAARYVVYYKMDGAKSYSKAGSTRTNKYEIKGLKAGTKYYVYVIAVFEVDGKVYTPARSATHTYTAPDQVKVNGGYTNEGVYEITWTDTTGRTAFEIRKYNDKTGKWDRFAGTVKTKYTYTVTSEEDSCRFKVRPYTKTEDGQFIWGDFSDNIEINAGRRGIDVSKWQGEIDWKKVAGSGIEFVIIKVGGRGYGKAGTIYEDPYFQVNIEGALANGIDVGIYFFSTAISEEEAVEEAKWTLNRIKGYNVTYPIVFDYEGYDNPDYRSYGQTRTNRSNYAIAFLDYVRSKGYLPMMYASQYYYNTQWDTDRLSDYNLWVAKYPSGNNGQLMEGREPKIEYPYAMWQYSSTGKVDGIQASNGAYRNVDMNYQYTSFKK